MPATAQLWLPAMDSNHNYLINSQVYYPCTSRECSFIFEGVAFACFPRAGIADGSELFAVIPSTPYATLVREPTSVVAVTGRGCTCTTRAIPRQPY